jgi:hypothetical protein
MKSKFNQLKPDTRAKITQIRKLIENLPGDGLVYIFDEILTGCLRKLSHENKLAEDLADYLGASGVLVFLLNDGHYRLESGHIKEAPAALVETLYAVGEAIKAVVSPHTPDRSGSIH